MGNTIHIARNDKVLANPVEMFNYMKDFRALAHGRVWTAKAAPVVAGWRSVAAGEGVIVAVASSGSGNRIMRSTDYGKTFVEVSDTGSYTLQKVVFGNGVFVAVGTTNCIRSTDLGLTWSDVPTGLGPYLAFDGANFITSRGEDGGVAIRKSTDNGATFELVEHDLDWVTAGAGDGMIKVYENGTYGMVMSGYGAISEDLESWTQIASLSQMNDMAFAGGRYVVSRNNTANFYYSDDKGDSWNAVEMPSENFGLLEYLNGVFIAHVLNSDDMYISIDGTVWRDITLPESLQIEGMTSIGGRLVGVSVNGTNRIVISDV